MPPKKKRRKVQTGGDNPTEEDKKKDFIINSTLEENEVQEILQRNELGVLKERMSRGQRKRFKNFEKKRDKKNVLEKIKSDFDIEEEDEIQPPRPMLSLEEGDTAEERFFLNMNDLEATLDEITTSNPVRDRKKRRNRKRKNQDMNRVFSEELNHFQNVLSHEFFQSDPNQAISEHLDNRIEMENMKLGIVPEVREVNIDQSNNVNVKGIAPPPGMAVSSEFERRQKIKSAATNNGKWRRQNRKKKKKKVKRKKSNRKTGKKRKRIEMES